MKRVRLAVAGIAVAALTIGVAAPAGAQEEPEALGFAVDKTQAQPGALVLGKANAADVAEHCVTDLGAFQARFEELLNGPFVFGALEGEFVERFFPDNEEVYENYGQVAYVATLGVVLGLAVNLNGAAETALPQTFVMTFADVATQEPVGARGNFDPSTGEGSVVVPDIDPGQWAVAAACVGPIIEDLDALEAGILESAEFLEEIGAPLAGPLFSEEWSQFAKEFLDDENASNFDVLAALGPDLVENIVTPDAFGAVLFCILDDQGACPGPPPPPPELDEDDVKDMAPPADAIVAAPSFTG